MKPRVFITRKLPEIAQQILSERCDVRIYSGSRPIEPRQLLTEIEEVEGVICLLTDRLSREAISRARKLRIISNYAVGFDNIDVTAATEAGILVTNTPGVLTRATAELTWSLIFAVARKLIPADRFLRNGEFHGWEPLLFLGTEIKGKTLGIVGMGRIGNEVARIALAFSMNILYYDHQKSRLDDGTSVKQVTLETLAEQSDIITFHVPLTRETWHLADAGFFARCKPEVLVINTSRGPVIDEDSLVYALERGIIGGAGLDVFEAEPAVHPGLIARDDVVLLPHLGSATKHTRNKMAELAATNIIQAFSGKIPDLLVNEEVLISKGGIYEPGNSMW